MYKYKLENKSGESRLIIQSRKGQQLCLREAYAAQNAQVQGLVPMQVQPKGREYKLIYHLSGLISLQEFLRNPLDRQSFSALLSSILQSLGSLMNAYFDLQMLLLHQECVMISPASREVLFVLVPLAPGEQDISLRDLFLEIIQRGRFAPGEDPAYVQEYIRIVNSGLNFSLFQLEQYAQSLVRGEKKDLRPRCEKCGNVPPPGTNFCPVCGTRLNQVQGWAEEGIYRPAARQQTAPQPQQAAYAVQPGAAPAQPAAVAAPQLYQVRTGEQIAVNSEMFLIGKAGEGVNCEVQNPTVSRRHACLACAEGRWFVQDLGSTNGSWLNGAQLVPGQYAEVKNGDSLRFATEDYIFYL